MLKDENKNIGKIIKIIRKTMNLTQSDLAKKLNISTQQFYKYENGHDLISAVKLKMIAELLQCDISVFFPKQTTTSTNLLKVSERKSEFYNKKSNKNKEAIELLKFFYSCNQSDKNEILSLAEKLSLNKKKQKQN